MNKIKEKYLNFIDERIAEYKCISERLLAEDRKEEADLELVKANIFELFRTIFIVDTRQLEGKDLSGLNDIDLYADYLLRFKNIPANWKIFMERAKEQNDATRLVVEETKIKVAQELKDQLISIFNEVTEFEECS